MYSKVVLFLTLVCVASSIPLKKHPEACTATKINISVSDNDMIVMNYSAVLSVRPTPGSPLTSVSITDIVSTTTNASMYNMGKGLLPTVTVDLGIPQKCSGTCQFSVKNSTFAINFPFMIKGNTAYETLIYNVIDEGAISTASGYLLTTGNACQGFELSTSEFPGIQFESSQCCVKTVDVKKSTTQSYCSKYSAAVVFYRNANKFANISIDLDDSANNFIFNATVSDSGTDNIDYFSFAMNGYGVTCQGNVGTQQKCTGYVTNVNYKALFQLTVWETNRGIYTMNAGRIIGRNSMPLQEEGLAFTPQNPCSYMGADFDNSAVTATSKFCCTQFSS